MSGHQKVFFSLNHDTDGPVYRELIDWLTSQGIDLDPWTTEDLELAGDEATASQSQLVNPVVNSEFVVVIVGNTPIDPESIDSQALNAAAWMKRPIIALNLNQTKQIDREHFPHIIAEQLVLHLPMEGQAFRHALKTWQDEAFRLRTMGQVGPIHFSPDIYETIEERWGAPQYFLATAPEKMETETVSRPWGHHAAA